MGVFLICAVPNFKDGERYEVGQAVASRLQSFSSRLGATPLLQSFPGRLGATFLPASFVFQKAGRSFFASVFFQKADSETGAAFFAAGEAQVFSGCRLDADAVGAATENRSQSLAHQIYAAS